MIKIQLLKYFVAGLLLLPSFTKADVCYRGFEEDVSISSAIFVGKVVHIEKIYFTYPNPKTVFTFEIQESFKGVPKDLNYISLIGPLEGCCNVHFLMDSTFLVFAYGNGLKPDLLYTNDCSNTGLLSNTQPIYKKLGRSVKHNSDTTLLKFVKPQKLKIDSLELVNQKLKNDLILASKSRRDQRWILGAAICFLGVLLIVMFWILKQGKR